MVFQSELLELKLAQTSFFPTAFKAMNRQLCQQDWLQLITSQVSETVESDETANHTNQELSSPMSNHDLHLDHESKVQWFACQLSKRTLRQYLNYIPVPLPLPAGGAHLEALPQDILDRICEYVPYEDLLRLYRLSKRLRATVDPQLAPYHTKLSFVLRAERDFPKHYTCSPPNLGCYMCHRVLPAGLFAIRQTQQALLRPTPLAQQTVVNLRRFCVYCGIRTGCHGRGDSLTMQTGAQCWLCECPQVYPERVPGCRDCRMFCPIVIRRADEAAARDAMYRVWELMK
ncbi:hypothetical protein F4818DRAFT_73308 [Hypoxylon cercidicola]|nr:hypothetical protein F4818DRAFT_73308 [Hypoxylon cercidicola]